MLGGKIMDAILAEIEGLMQLGFYAVGAIMAGVGIMNFAEGQSGNDGAASLKGGKLIAAGVIVFAIGNKLVPLIFNLFK